jgi:hypothetical protein
MRNAVLSLLLSTTMVPSVIRPDHPLTKSLRFCCAEFCPSELGTREAATFPDQQQNLQNAAIANLASEWDSGVKLLKQLR